jgi:hypothetical protein
MDLAGPVLAYHFSPDNTMTREGLYVVRQTYIQGKMKSPNARIP